MRLLLKTNKANSPAHRASSGENEACMPGQIITINKIQLIFILKLCKHNFGFSSLFCFVPDYYLFKETVTNLGVDRIWLLC